MLERQDTILEGYSDKEKGAYLGSVAAIVTADRSATAEEIEFIQKLCEHAALSDDQMSIILEAANRDVADEELKSFLSVLKTSDLRFSLVTDLIALAESDHSYSENEKNYVKKISDFLGVNQEQLSLLDRFTRNTLSEDASASVHESSSEQNALLEQLKKSGIGKGVLMSALSIAGPMILSSLLNRRAGNVRGLDGTFGETNNSGRGILGGLLSGLGSRARLGGLVGGNDTAGLLGGLGGAGSLIGRILGGR